MRPELAISDAEYAKRLAALRGALEARDLPVAIVQGARNWYRDHAIRYLTGYDSPLAPSLLLVFRDGRAPVLLLRDADDLARARAATRIAEPVGCESLAAALVEQLRERRLEPRRIGIAGGECMGFSALDVLPADIARALDQAFPGSELVDVGGDLLASRMVRSDSEIALLREAAHVADIGAEIFLATVRQGVSERDLWSEIWHAMQQAGAEDLHISLCRGPASFWPHPPSDAVFAAGDIVSIELSPRVGGYFSQANRMCFVGEPNREWQDLAALAKAALATAIGAMRPGIAAKEVVASVSRLIGQSPLATMDVGGVHRIGHGCGISLDEGPFLTSASTISLRPNMTMACHPIIYLPYRHSLLMLGDYVRITEDGAEVLTRPQSTIPVV